VSRLGRLHRTELKSQKWMICIGWYHICARGRSPCQNFMPLQGDICLVVRYPIGGGTGPTWNSVMAAWAGDFQGRDASYPGWPWRAPFVQSLRPAQRLISKSKASLVLCSQAPSFFSSLGFHTTSTPLQLAYKRAQSGIHAYTPVQRNAKKAAGCHSPYLLLPKPWQGAVWFSRSTICSGEIVK